MDGKNRLIFVFKAKLLTKKTTFLLSVWTYNMLLGERMWAWDEKIMTSDFSIELGTWLGNWKQEVGEKMKKKLYLLVIKRVPSKKKGIHQDKKYPKFPLLVTWFTIKLMNPSPVIDFHPQRIQKLRKLVNCAEVEINWKHAEIYHTLKIIYVEIIF